ncbi:MAG: hypothetical protein IJW02_01675 [Clostridia bacterium]|nr:hypothetical protein [Clostridia bacterium]
MIYFTISSVLTLMLTFAEYLDTRRPMSSNIKYKFRVKDDSILRKIIKFKDKEYYPCNYFKIVPIYIYLIITTFSIALLLFDSVTNGVISDVVPDNVFLILSLCTFLVYLVYIVVVLIWWEIVDHNEFKFTKEEKDKLKQLRKLRKNNNKNSKL